VNIELWRVKRCCKLSHSKSRYIDIHYKQATELACNLARFTASERWPTGSKRGPETKKSKYILEYLKQKTWLVNGLTTHMFMRKLRFFQSFLLIKSVSSDSYTSCSCSAICQVSQQTAKMFPIPQILLLRQNSCDGYLKHFKQNVLGRLKIKIQVFKFEDFSIIKFKFF